MKRQNAYIFKEVKCTRVLHSNICQRAPVNCSVINLNLNLNLNLKMFSNFWWILAAAKWCYLSENPYLRRARDFFLEIINKLYYERLCKWNILRSRYGFQRCKEDMRGHGKNQHLKWQKILMFFGGRPHQECYLLDLFWFVTTSQSIFAYIIAQSKHHILLFVLADQERKQSIEYV